MKTNNEYEKLPFWNWKGEIITLTMKNGKYIIGSFLDFWLCKHNTFIGIVNLDVEYINLNSVMKISFGDEVKKKVKTIMKAK